MAQRIDPRYFPSLIDGNVLDRGHPDDAAVDEVLSLHEAGKIAPLSIPHSVKAEIEHPNTPAEKRRRAAAFLFTCPVSLTPPEQKRHAEVRDVVRGNARPGKHDRDAYHMVEAAKYGGYFITRDDRLIRKRDAVMQHLGQGFAIVTPTEFLSAYRLYVSMP